MVYKGEWQYSYFFHEVVNFFYPGVDDRGNCLYFIHIKIVSTH